MYNGREGSIFEVTNVVTLKYFPKVDIVELAVNGAGFLDLDFEMETDVFSHSLD